MASQPSDAGNGTRAVQPLKGFSNWMGELDARLHNVPLSYLAIPGSHNSFIYRLDKSGDVSPDAPQAIVYLVKVFGPLAKSIIYNWSVTQTLNVTQQLTAGVRYFDVRLATRPGSTDLFCVHGLYGPTINECLDSVDKFLKMHSKEIIILDFRAFYNFDRSTHTAFMDSLTERFGSVMAPVVDLASLTLSMLWDSGLQLLVFYHCDDVIDGGRVKFWRGRSILSPWPNVTDVTKLLDILSANLANGRPTDRMYVSQGVLTPDVGCIVRNICKDLKGCLAKPLAPKYVEWIRHREEQGGENGRVNICIMDFAEMNGYIETVMRLNAERASKLKLAGVGS